MSEAMNAAEIDPAELAFRSGFSVAQIERWQAGQSIIYCGQILVLCRVLGVTSAALFAKDKRRLH